MIKRYFLKNLVRKLISIFLLLVAYPVVHFVLGSDNLTDRDFWAVMFIPEITIAIIYLITSSLFWIFLRKRFKIHLALDIGVLLILLIILFSPFPNLHAEISRHNEEIDTGIRSNIQTLSDKIIKSIKNNDPNTMYNLFVKEMKDKGIDNIKKLCSQFSEEIKGKEFKPYNEYYVVIQSWRAVPFIVPSETVEESLFHIHINTTSNNVYISLLSTEGEFKDLIFCFVYVRIKGKWQLHAAHLGVLRLGGRMVPEWLQEAKKLSVNGFDAPAILRLNVANQFLRPAPFIQYAKEQEFINLYKEIQTRIKNTHTFPIRLSDITSTPEIFYIEPRFVQMDLLPMISYVTKIPFDNAPELQKEVEEMTTRLESIFPGITKNVTHVVYKAFSEPPIDQQKSYNYYGLSVEVN